MSNKLEKEERISDTKRIHRSEEPATEAIRAERLARAKTDEELIAEHKEKIKDLEGKIEEIKKAKIAKINEQVARLLSKTNEFGRQVYTQSEVKELSGASATTVKKVAKELKLEKQIEIKD